MSRLDIHVGEEVFEGWGSKTIFTSEGVAIERAYGKTFAEFTAAIDAGSIYALQVLAWSLLRRRDPGLKLGQVDLPIGDIRLVLVCETCGRTLAAKISDEEVNGVTVRSVVLRDGVTVRIHEDDETDECGTEPKEEDPDPFEHGSNGTGQDSSTTDEPDT